MNHSPLTVHRIPYRPEIDGLRAVAVLIVLLFHVRLGCPGGYVGVDVFFVISGFLITSLIQRDLAAGTFRFADFWERRVRRIVPALAFALLVILVVGWFVSLPDDYARLGKMFAPQILGLSNVAHWRLTGYFTPDAEALPLLHTWSLAVEEQFYLVLPFAMWGMRAWSSQSRQAVLGIATLDSLGLGIWATKSHPAAAYYLLPSRAWEMLLGACLAIWSPACSRPVVREAVSLMGLVAIGVATTTFRETTPFPGTAALLPTVGTAMFIWANQASTTHSGAILAWRPIVFVGQISYSLYLLHWPVIVFTTSWFRDLITWKWRLGMLAAAFAGAILSWALVETPTRRKRWLATRRSLFVGAGVSLVLLMGAGVVIHRQAGIPSRFDTQTLKYATQDREERFQVNTTLEQLQRGQLIDFGTPGQPVTQLVWGDSHAMALMTGFDTACRKRGLRGQAVLYSSTAPLLGFVSRERYSVSDSPRYAQAVVDFALTHEIRQVFLVAFWRSYVDDPGFEDGLRDTVAALTAAGIQIVLVRDVPTQSEPVPRALARTYLLGGDVHRVGVAISQHRQQNESVDRLLSQVAGEDCVVIDPTMLLTDETGLCRAELDGVALYFDAHHLSTTGSRRIAPLIENVLPSRLKEKSP